MAFGLCYRWMGQYEGLFPKYKQPPPIRLNRFLSVPAIASVTAWKGYFYIDTNEKATHHHIFKVSADHPERKNWKEIVPERPHTTIQDMKVAGNCLLLETF